MVFDYNHGAIFCQEDNFYHVNLNVSIYSPFIFFLLYAQGVLPVYLCAAHMQCPRRSEDPLNYFGWPFSSL